MDAPYLIYAVGTLMPAIALGVHAIKVVCSSDEQSSNSLLKKSCSFIAIAKVYVGVFGMLAVLLPFSGFIASYFDQLELQNITSVRKMLFWQAKHWLGAHYCFCLCLSVLFLSRIKSRCCDGHTVQNEL